MKVEKYENAEERQILIGMITNTAVLSRIAPQWNNKGLFLSKWSSLLGSWCVKYFHEHGEAPNANIESIFYEWTNGKARDEPTTNSISYLLGDLSGEYTKLAEEYNPDHVIDIAGKYFQRVRLRGLAEEIQANLAFGDLDAASSLVTDFDRVELGVGAGINVLEDDAAIQAVFEEGMESLIDWPDELAGFFGTEFQRDSFIAVLAPEKRGKTHWLTEIAWRAMLSKCKVAFFEVGDMSERQIMQRMVVRIARHPFIPCTVEKPVSIVRDDEGNVEVETESKVFKERLSFQKVIKVRDKLKKHIVQPYLRLSVHPNSSIGIEGINAILQGWSRDGWSADICIIDYADNLDLPKSQEHRHSTNALWKQMRRLSQEFHCCLVTATQADAASYDRALMTKANFSENKLKNAHVTAMLALNQTREEKGPGMTEKNGWRTYHSSRYRLSWIVCRNEAWSEYTCLHVAGCLALSRPYVVACF